MDGKFYVSTPLMAATENDDQALAVILLGHRADVNKRDWWQNTALLKAVQVGGISRNWIKIKKEINYNNTVTEINYKYGLRQLCFPTIKFR